MARVHDGLNARYQDGQQAKHKRDKKDQKTCMVTDTNAVIEPWAVMVESFNAAIADGTMS